MSQSKFAHVGDKFSFPQEEAKTLEYWESINAFHKSLELSKGKPEYTFYDGPPFATGLPHYGHILAGTIKDTVTRYAHQTDHFVSRRFGWDCHGLPVEYEIDKKLNITGRQMVLDMGVDVYNNECRGIVQRYTKEWEKTVTRLGRWIDFKDGYKTMDPSFMESVWWVFKTMFEKGLVYRGYKVMPYSTFCGTPLSNFEAGLNYKDVKDPAVVVSFPLVDNPDVELLAWTTTPWTLPSNLALCVNSTFDYVKILDKARNKKFIILEKRLGQLYPEVNKADCTDERKAELYEVLERIKGEALVGLKYVPIFDYFANRAEAFRVVADNYVTEEGGTGIVHQAPAFGEDDYRVCIANGIVSKGEDLPCPVDSNGFYTNEIPEFVGRLVKECDNDICQLLKGKGRLISKEVYSHSYPFCWRSETPLIYKAVPSWFVAVEKIKPNLIANNNQTYWVPSFVQEKRFHNWLSDAKDWAISRNRFWGTPIPLWISDDFEEMVAVGSLEELEQLSGVRLTDLHKEFVDKVTIPSKMGKGTLKRIDEVFDCWFESGSMPYAQLHYPFENSDRFENGFPADFIAEGLDQTRGWFYTLMVISTALFDKPAFKNLIVNGLVLAADGKKMSKRLKNYPDPTVVVDECGADALRLYLINSPVVRADVLKFQQEGVVDVLKTVLIPWYNTFRFFTQSVDRLETATGKDFVPNPDAARKSTNDVDVWIIAASESLVSFVHREMKAYRLYTVVPALVEFVDQLSRWYVRLNRFRIKGEFGEEEAYIGCNVMYEVLKTITVLMAPFTPFFTEYLYSQLRILHPDYKNPDASPEAFGKAESVHFVMLPQPNDSAEYERAVNRFKVLQEAISLSRMAREKRRIRPNLPVKEAIIVVSNQEEADALNELKSYFLNEANTWDITISADWEKYCSLKIQPNFKELGKRLGKQMKDVANQITNMSFAQATEFMKNGTINIAGFDLSISDLLVKREFNGDKTTFEAVSSDSGNILVALNTTWDDQLQAELRVRTFVSAVQKLRKQAKLTPADKIEIFFEVENATSENNDQALLNFLLPHRETIEKRLRLFPVQLSKRNEAHSGPVFFSESVEESDLWSSPIRFHLVHQFLAPNLDKIKELVDDESFTSKIVNVLLTSNYEQVISQESFNVNVDGKDFVLTLGQHYFASYSELVYTNL